MPDENSAALTVPAPIEEAAEMLQAAPETLALLQLFDRMDATAPLMRLAYGGNRS